MYYKANETFTHPFPNLTQLTQEKEIQKGMQRRPSAQAKTITIATAVRYTVTTQWMHRDTNPSLRVSSDVCTLISINSMLMLPSLRFTANRRNRCNLKEHPDNQISHSSRPPSDKKTSRNVPNITLDSSVDTLALWRHKTQATRSSLKLRLEQRTLGANSTPVSLSFARLELQVFRILVVTRLCRFELKLRQSHATVSLGHFQHRSEK